MALSEEQIVSRFEDALNQNRIYVCYQAQINHTTGRMVGAEALIRWKDPELGQISPADFIPVLEKHNLIYKADMFVFKEVCQLQRYCLDSNIQVVPISVNMSRLDVDGNYIEDIEAIRKRYDIPVKHLRIEITESFAIGGSKPIIDILDRLHDIGYVVEMDDFGSGYSSLNILKDLDVDVIKFDMRFLSGGIGNRGGTIISSMMHMAKWLDTPVIAEGVETMEQADFMQSIGCNYIQGFLYTKPVEKNVFVQKLKELTHEPMASSTMLFRDIISGRFWNPNSMDTLLFNQFVGPAAIFTYQNGKVEIQRVNKKYIKELGANVSGNNILESDPLESCDKDGRKQYEDAIKIAIDTRKETECESWRTIHSECCGEDHLCIRSSIQMIGQAADQYLFFATIRNITAEKEAYEKLSEDRKKFIIASDQNNTFSWEYDIATKEMRPCSRCQRVLGFPSVIYDYPEPVFENGLFPAEFADEYRDWHKRLANGETSLEAVVPLTKDRVPFHIRYTAEFDENGRPFKAYGSATQVTS